MRLAGTGAAEWHERSDDKDVGFRVLYTEARGTTKKYRGNGELPLT